MRFSLGWLLVAVAFVAVSCVALLNADGTWQRVLQNASLFLFLVAIAGAVWLMKEKRAFWSGYVLFGLPYFVLATGFFGYSRSSHLASTTALSYIHGRLFSSVDENVPHPFGTNFRGGDIVSMTNPLPDGSINVSVVRPEQDDFVAVGNTILCVPFGLVGGLIARHLYRRSRKESDLLKEVTQ